MDVDRSKAGMALMREMSLQWSHVLMDVDSHAPPSISISVTNCFNGATS